MRTLLDLILQRAADILLVPVILGLILLLILTLAMVGGVLAEGLERRRRGPGQGEGAPAPRLLDRARALASRDTQFVMGALEIEAERALGRLQAIVRVGPMLGLAGTLIPLGPALEGLGRGDLRAFSANLATAFATTVLGLVSSGLAYVLHGMRRRWYARDLLDVESILRREEP